MEKLSMLPENQHRLMLHSRHHIEKLARHLFKNDPAGLKKVARVFSEKTVIQPEIRPPKPRDFTMHHIPQ
jgi:hypothetical protein